MCLMRKLNILIRTTTSILILFMTVLNQYLSMYDLNVIVVVFYVVQFGIRRN
jgi:hypothetical protein